MLIGEKAAAIGNSISLTNWEGSATGSVSGNSTTTHTIRFNGTFGPVRGENKSS